MVNDVVIAAALSGFIAVFGTLCGVGITHCSQLRRDERIEERQRRENYARTLAELQEATAELIAVVLAIRARQIQDYQNRGLPVPMPGIERFQPQWPGLTPSEYAELLTKKNRVEMLNVRIDDDGLRTLTGELLHHVVSIVSAESSEQSKNVEQELRQLYPQVNENVGQLIRTHNTSQSRTDRAWWWFWRKSGD